MFQTSTKVHEIFQHRNNNMRVLLLTGRLAPFALFDICS